MRGCLAGLARSRACRLRPGGGGGERHGGLVAGPGLADRRRHPRLGGQRRRCSGGGGLRRSGREPLLRQSRRRRLPAGPHRHGPEPLRQFPREGPRSREPGHVSRRERQGRGGLDPSRLEGGGRARHGARPHQRPVALWHPAAGQGDGPGHRPGAGRLRPDAGRHRHPGDRHGEVRPGPGRGEDLPAARRDAVPAGGQDGPGRSRPHPPGHRRGRAGRLLQGQDPPSRRGGLGGGRRDPDREGFFRLHDHRRSAALLPLPGRDDPLGAAAVVRRDDAVRDAGDPRRLRHRGLGLQFGPHRPPDGRGDAARLCRPQRDAGRSGLRGQPGRAAGFAGLRAVPAEGISLEKATPSARVRPDPSLLPPARSRKPRISPSSIGTATRLR